MTAPVCHVGQRFDGPDGQAYVATRDIWPGERLSSEQFVPVGGAPHGRGVEVPSWFLSQVRIFTAGRRAL